MVIGDSGPADDIVKIEANSGEVLELFSTHCISCDKNWLIAPVILILEENSEYSRGKQRPHRGVKLNLTTN